MIERYRVGAGLYQVSQMNAMVVDAIDSWLHQGISSYDIDTVR